MRLFTSVCLGFLLLWNQWAFGGVHVWAETASQVAIFGLAWLILCLAVLRLLWQDTTSRLKPQIRLARIPHPAIPFFLLFLLWSGWQLLPLPPEAAGLLSPGIHSAYQQLLRADVWREPHWIPLTLEWFRSLQVWVEHASSFLFFLLALYCLRDRKPMERFIAFLLFLALFQVVYGLTQTYSATQNIWWWENTLYPGWLTGTYLGRNNLAGFLELTIPLSFGLGAALWPKKPDNGLERSRRRPGRRRHNSSLGAWFRKAFVDREGLSKSLLFLSLGSLLGVGLLLTGSRGGILSFAAGCLVMALLLALKRSSRFFGGITALAALLIILLGLYIGVEHTAERFLHVQGLENRMQITRSVWRMVRDYPVSGVGLGNFNDAYTPKYAPEAFSQGNQLVYAHNDWVQAGAELGFPGLALAVAGYLTVLVLALRQWHKRRDRYVRCLGAGLIAGYIALGIHSFFDYNLHIPANILTFLVCLVLMHRVLQLRSRSRNHSGAPQRSITLAGPRVRVVLLLLLAGFSLAAYSASGFIVRQYQAEAQCPTRINSTKDFSGDPTVQETQTAVALSPNNPEYRIESGRAYLRLLQGEDKAIASALLPEAASGFQHGVRLDPANGRGWYLLGQTLARMRYHGSRDAELERIALCFDLARRYRPDDARIALEAGTTMLWLASLSPREAAEAGLASRAAEAYQVVLRERRGKWKEIVERIRRYNGGLSVLRAAIPEGAQELRERMVGYYEGE